MRSIAKMGVIAAGHGDESFSQCRTCLRSSASLVTLHVSLLVPRLTTQIVDLEAQVARHKARTTQMKNELRLEVEAAKARDAAAARKHRAQVEAEAAATAVKVAAEREAARIRRMHAELEAHAVEIEQRTIPEVQARLVGAAAVEAEEEVDVEPQASQLDSEVSIHSRKVAHHGTSNNIRSRSGKSSGTVVVEQ